MPYKSVNPHILQINLNIRGLDMDVKTFLNTSYTSFHAVKNAIGILEKNGFILYDGKKAEKGGKYYVTKNGSALIAFKVGDLNNYAFNIAESHTDSPALKVKGKTLLDSAAGKRINVEAYGGLIRYSFMDIPLKTAGRLFVKTENGVSSRLVESDFNVNIPSLCVHHNADVNTSFSLNVQTDMLPLIGGDDTDLYKVLLPDNEVIDGDLYVVPSIEARVLGVKSDILCSPRIDNLTSAYSSVKAIIDCEPKGVAIACLFDNEEIGSGTKQGADSAFLPELLKKINSDLGYGENEYLQAKANGFVLSIDNGHAVHPAHPEKSDVNEKVYLNGGIVVKHHANYSTDGLSSALIKSVFDKNGVKHQDYYNRSDLRCGGTLGLITSAQLQMNAADIGLAQLAMHSAIETVGADDISVMERGIKAFFNTSFKFCGDSVEII